MPRILILILAFAAVVCAQDRGFVNAKFTGNLSLGAATVASAGTTDLGRVTGPWVTVTGSEIITSFGVAPATSLRYLLFTGSPTLTHNAGSLILPGGADIPVPAGSTAVAISEGSGNWRVLNYLPSSGTPIVTVPITKGGTGATSASAARTALSAAASGANTDITSLTGTGTVRGSTASNGDLTLEGTTSATKTSSYVIIQPTAGNVGINTTTPQAALDLGTGRSTGGTSSATFRNYLNLSSSSAFAAIDVVFPGGASTGQGAFSLGSGVFRAGQVSVQGTNDIFFQLIPLTTSGYGYLEAWESAGLILGTGNNATPVVIRPNRTTTAQFHASGGLSVGTANVATDPGNGSVKASGLLLNVVAKTAAYTATSADYTVLCNATSGAFSVTLPAAASNAGRIYVIKKTDGSANAVTIDPNASETIDSAATLAISTQWQSRMIQCDGSAWFVIGN